MGRFAAVRRRLTAINEASASLVLFMEYVPHRLDIWLADQASSEERAVAAYDMVDRSLHDMSQFMSTHGFVHFDAHLRNLLTDGRRIYLADFGLAVHAGFDLTPAESGFLEQHRNYDRCYTATQFTFWLIGNVFATAWPDSLAYLRENRAAGYPELPAAARALVQRHARIAELMGSFWRRMELDRTTPYPYIELDEALTAPDADPLRQVDSS